MGNWSITIKGIGPKKGPRELAQAATNELVKQGQNITSAEFISDTPEDSLNLLAERDLVLAREDFKKTYPNKDLPAHLEDKAPVAHPDSPEAA